MTRTIGPYELEGLLGEGGIGQVYVARDTVLGRPVAIKMLRPELSRDRSFVERFYNEAKSLANLNHTNITTLYALHVEGDEAYMVMELVHGQTLEALLARLGRLTLRDSLAVLAQAVPGIRYAHRRGIIHRDLKPSNLMVTDDGTLKIMDFGIARVRGTERLTQVGEFCGTFVYASPEQIRGEEVDERSDLYSLGVVFYRMLTGVPPFTSNNEYALMTAQLQTPPPPLAGRVPDLEPGTEPILMRALAKRREERFASVDEFGRAVGAMAMREESPELLQLLYARAFAPADVDATRIAAGPPAAAPAPTIPSVRSPPQTNDWALPPSLADGASPPAPAASSRQSVLDAAPVTAPPAGPVRQAARRGNRRGWAIGAGAVALVLVLAGGYRLLAGGRLALPFAAPPEPAATAAAMPAAPATADKDASAAPGGPAAAANGSSAESTPAPPAPPNSEPQLASATPTPAASPKAKIATTPEATPKPTLAATAATEKAPSPAPAETATSPPQPPASPKSTPPKPAPAEIAPAQTASAETAPAETAQNKLPPEPPAPSPSPAPPPSPVPPPTASPPQGAASAASPAPTRKADRVAAAARPRSPPPSKPNPPPPKTAPAAKPAKEAAPAPAKTPSAPVEVAKNEAPANPDKPAPLGPQAAPGPPQPEGPPDLEGKVTGARRLDEIEVAGHWIRIYGIVDHSRGSRMAKHIRALISYLKPSHNHLVCYRKPRKTYRCYSNGHDIARLALRDHLVRLARHAPAEYRAALTDDR